MISKNLDTWELPDPDLLIRTSGEQRLSNYLPWQLAYTEFYFTDVHWPDFNKEELIRAFEKYDNENKNFKRNCSGNYYGFGIGMRKLVFIRIKSDDCTDWNV